MGPTLITSTRLLDAAPGARAAWHALLAQVYADLGVPVAFVDHGWPTPIGELWSRPGLYGAFMCGWPFVRARLAGRDMQAVAAVVPDWPAYEGQARYRSEFLVRADCAWTELADAFDTRYGWMVEDSQSGWNAPRYVLSRYASADRQALFAASLGPHGNPRRTLAALIDNAIDITALDGWYLDLLRAHEPELMARVRTLATTPWTPNPLLVASPEIGQEQIYALRSTLLSLHRHDRYADLLKKAHVARFAEVNLPAYDALESMATEAARRHYPAIR